MASMTKGTFESSEKSEKHENGKNFFAAVAATVTRKGKVTHKILQVTHDSRVIVTHGGQLVRRARHLQYVLNIIVLGGLNKFYPSKM